MYRKLFWSATKDCSGAGNPLGNVDVGEMAFILVMCAVIVEKISLAGTNPESLRLSLRISLILRKIWPWTELGPTGSNQELFLYLTRPCKTEISSH